MSAHSEDVGAVKDANERLDDKSAAVVEDRLADHIRAIVDCAPSPTAEQAAKLRALLPPPRPTEQG